jgi:hypothetical protein
MRGRIGSLHVRYRVPPGARLGPAAAAGIDRVLAEELGAVVADRLERLLGPDEEVVVIREATARLALRPSQWAANSEMLGRFGRAAADAVVDLIAAPPTDSVARFADQAEFIGRFLLELCDGTAWDRWYFGAFVPLRRPGAAETAAAVLAEYAADVPAVLGWLARQQQLSRFLRVVDPRVVVHELDRLAGLTPEASRTADLVPLFQAAWQLLAATGFRAGGSLRRAIEARYLESRQVPPSWNDRRSLTAWVLGFMRFAAPVLECQGPASDLEARTLLAGPLDWLDAAWLKPRLATLAGGEPIGDTESTVLTEASRARLDALAAMVRRGDLSIARDEDERRAVLHLVAALESEAPGASRDRGLLAALKAVVEAWRDDPAAAKASRIADAGPEARALLDALECGPLAAEFAGMPSRAGGLFLLVRALEDIRLLPLASRLGIRREPLLAGLARQLLSIEPPFDEATSLWIGDPGALDAGSGLPQLGEVIRELAATVALQRGEAAEAEQVEPSFERMATLLLRAWSRWLPGFSEASPEFLAANCLRRESRISITEGEVAVRLAPASLDVVLRMAGYLQPIDRIPWLGGRRIVFDVAERWE